MTSSTTAALTKSRREEEPGIMGWNLLIECSVAAATAAAATAPAAREPARRFGGCAVASPIRRTENGKLNRVLLPRALRAGNLLRLVQHNLLKVRLAILADVFVYRHCPHLPLQEFQELFHGHVRLPNDAPQDGNGQIKPVVSRNRHPQLRLPWMLQLRMAPALMIVFFHLESARHPS